MPLAHPPPGLGELLAEHCRILKADGGSILRLGPDRQVQVAAVHPPPGDAESPTDWLARAVVSARPAAEGDQATVVPLHDPDELYGQGARRHLVVFPLRAGGRAAVGVAAVVAQTDDGADLAARAAQTQLAMSAMALYGALLRQAGAGMGAAGLADATAVLASVNEHDRFLPAAMAFANEIAARWQCERVCLGFLKGHCVQLQAMSHADRFSRKTQAVQLIEAAMEECLDQDLETAHWPAPSPPPSLVGDFVSRAAGELSRHDGGLAVLSLPLRRAGRAVGVATLERAAERPFDDEQVESLRLACDLCTPRLLDLRRQERWIGSRLAEGLGTAAGGLLGPRHAAAKLAAALTIAASIALGLARGTYRIDAPFVLEASQRRVVSAPFSGQIEEVLARPGDKVTQGQPLARLRTGPLQRSLSAARAELFEYDKQADSARSEKRWAEVQMALAKVAQLREQIQLLDEQIEKALVRAPLSGTVIRGELEQSVGTPVEKGQVLFQVARMDSLRAVLAVPEDQIADLLEATARGPVEGTLAAASYPQEKIQFVVDRIHPTAISEDGQAVVKVWATPRLTCGWMRPGMGGLAQIPLGRRSYGFIWTRRLANWLRLHLWW